MRPGVEHGAANQLDVEVPHVEHAAAGLADDRERFGQQVVERLAVGESRPELGRLAAQLLVGQRLDGRFECADLAHDRTQLLQIAFVLGADDLGEDCLDHLPGRTAVGIQ